ncbi:hypothetical protein Tco_0976388 [Tanacetum coccineum]|uniref:Uncharacterized protein n=1 Tax=Tanacetum coccineum TaxID=301880 RepID=A0ABQ5EH79_9ASTR
MRFSALVRLGRGLEIPTDPQPHTHYIQLITSHTDSLKETTRGNTEEDTEDYFVTQTLSQKVLDLENTKTSQAVEITKLKERVKKLERRNKSRTPGLKRLRMVGRSVQVVSSKDEDEKEVKVEKVVSTAEVTTVSATTTTVDDLTLA